MIYDDIKRNINMTRHDGEFGIEIETETIDAYRIPNFKFWASHADGSLRNFGMEYVLKAPLTHDEIPVALAEFEQKMPMAHLIDSPYTSVHVHVNMQNEDWVTLSNFLTVYSLMENVLVRYSGPDRVSNLFCLPIKDAEGCLDNIMSVLTAVQKRSFGRIRLSEDNAKYSALNLATLYTLGTAEIRTFRGVTNVKPISDWVTIIKRIKDFSRSETTPVDIVNLCYADPVEFYKIVLGDSFSQVKDYDIKKLTESNLIYAARIAALEKPEKWREFGKAKMKNVSRVGLKDLDAYAVQMYGISYDSLNLVQRILVEEAYVNAKQNVILINPPEGDM